MLRDHMAAASLTALDREALLFTSPGGAPLRYTNWLRRRWYPATIAAGLGRLVEDEATGRHHYIGLGFHDLRRASATSLVASAMGARFFDGPPRGERGAEPSAGHEHDRPENDGEGL
jgi:integrase